MSSVTCTCPTMVVIKTGMKSEHNLLSTVRTWGMFLGMFFRSIITSEIGGLELVTSDD